MVKYRKCAVLNCEDRQSHRHRFPNPDKNLELFKKWVEECGNKSLINVDPGLIYRSHRVCHVHFRECDRSTNMYLLKGSIPCLFLSTPPDNIPPTISSNSKGKFSLIISINK